MNPASSARPSRCRGFRRVLLAGWIAWVASSASAGVLEGSPAAELVSSREAWTRAETFVAANPGSAILVGSGDSMLPLYRDRTVLVIQAVPMSELKPGMTVVFIGDRGRPVAHTLVERTPRGWIAIGANNSEPDRTRVQFRNYIGTVVKAFAPI